MKENKFSPPSFERQDSKAFMSEVGKELKNYFSEKKLRQTGDKRLLAKVPVMFGIYLIPYLLIILCTSSNSWLNIFFCVMMGVGMAVIGLSLMHDANHGSASSKSWVNKLLGFSLNFLGGHNTCWKIQHNVLHHTYTNVDQYDEDITTVSTLRFSPHTPLKKVHRYQHLYAIFFYSLMTFKWVSVQDFQQIIKYNRKGLLKTQQTNITREIITIGLSKVFYFGYIVIVPYFFSGYSVLEILIGFIVFQFIAGLSLALIFQPAHVTEETVFPTPNEKNKIEEDWIIHQLKTTMNFGTSSRIFTWFIGGLNHQIEHHLFPNISHVHYHNISKIVKKAAKKHNLPYIEASSFLKALEMHFKMLKHLGRGVS